VINEKELIFMTISLFTEGQTTIIFRREETPVSSSIRKSNSSNLSTTESTKPRSKTASTSTSTIELPSNNSSRGSLSTGFNLLQSIKDLTHQELYRANPLGLLGKEVISFTGTTHCPEPIPPNENNETINNTGVSGTSPNKLSPIDENEPQQIHFPLNEEEKIHMLRRRSTLANTMLAPCPAEYIPNENDDDLQPHLFSQLSPGTMIADFIPDTMTINVFEVFIYAWGVLAFFLDMFTDLVLAHAYYQEGAYWLFILTLMCVVVPNLTLSIFSLVWYIDGIQLKAAANTTEYNTTINETNSSNDILEKDINSNEQGSNNNNTGSELIPLHQRRNSFCQTDELNGEDQIDAHMSRLRQRPETPEKGVQEQHRVVKRKHFGFSATTAKVLTWIIRIIILVLQLDLCLK
jgi:cell division protein FtsL